MKIKSTLLTAGVCVLLGMSSVSAQETQKCGNPGVMENLYKQYPELKIEEQQYEQQLQQDVAKYLEGKKASKSSGSGAPKHIIPLVFHIIHNYGAENISDAQIMDAVNILNRDFRKRNADTASVYSGFQSIIADTEIEFRLAKLDPNGNCTNGIERIQSLQTNVGGDGAKINQWPRQKYLNIWVVANIQTGVTGNAAAGYALFPTSVAGASFPLDGIMIIHTYVGSIGTGSVFQSRALTHEVGHSLGLQHPWGSTNNPGVTCGDDGVADTPITKGWTSCPTSTAAKVCSTSVVENYENYMDYSYCSKMYTVGQKDAMLAVLSSSVAGRSTLGSPANNIATGTNDGFSASVCKPNADFSVSSNFVCLNGSLVFYNNTWGATADSIRWSFHDGTPFTTTANNVSVQFTTPGWKQISLTAYNSAGSDTKTVTKYVYVSSSTINYTNSYTFDFEDQTAFDNEWIVSNQTGSPSGWAITNSAASMATHSLKLNSFFNALPAKPFFTNDGDIDEVITPAIDFSGMPSTDTIRLVFRMACATRATSSSYMKELFRVYSSENCGSFWSKRYEITGTTLMNAGYSPTAFTPTASNWVTRVVKLPVSLKKPNVRFKFYFSSTTFSNNVYLDAVNFVNNSVGLEEASISDMGSLDIYPNPANRSSNITYTLTQKQRVRIAVYDVVGNLVADLKNEIQPEGDYNVSLNRNNMTNGLYFVRFELDGQQSVKKVIFTE